MSPSTTSNPIVIRTERGLSIAGTRITLYDVMDHLAAGCPPALIPERLCLSSAQIADALDYIESHRTEVEAEYQAVLANAAENRRYWEERNRDRFGRIAASKRAPSSDRLHVKLKAWSDKLARAR